MATSMTGMMSVLERMGVRYHTKEGKRRRPARGIPWLGFEVDTRCNVARLGKRKISKRQRLRGEIFSARPGAVTSGRGLLAAASFLNFLHCSPLAIRMGRS